MMIVNGESNFLINYSFHKNEDGVRENKYRCQGQIVFIVPKNKVVLALEKIQQ